ncbi:MAG: hypothetical protein ACI97A_000141 [Planctomycetota bacterium]
MTHDDFLELVYSYMDGELDDAQRHEVEVYLESSEEAQALVEFESRFQDTSRDLLNESSDMVTKGRILAQFRKDAGLSTQGSVESKLDPAPSGGQSKVLLFLKKTWQMPIAAGIMFLVAWMSGAFDNSRGLRPTTIPSDANSASTQLIDVVRVSDSRFTKLLVEKSKDHDCRYECVKQSLKGQIGSAFFAPNSTTNRDDRRATVAKLASDCMKQSVNIPCLPERFELVGARRTGLEFNGKTIEVPHLIMMSEDETLSVYVICDSQSAEIAKGLHEIASSKTKESCLLGCPQRGVMVRKCNDVWLVLISKMAYKKLKVLAEEI